MVRFQEFKNYKLKEFIAVERLAFEYYFSFKAILRQRNTVLCLILYTYPSLIILRRYPNVLK